ncbi:MAG: Maf family protein [Baekduia sp.]
MSPVVLASGSPQRRRILEDLGLDFEVMVPDVPEREAGDPEEVAVANAVAKVRAVSGDFVVGCDTVVATEAGLWGKPRDEEDALRTLEHLSGRTHRVVSGLAVRRDGALSTAVETTFVTFRTLEGPERHKHVAKGEWRGRAGGYAIQGSGAVLVERIEGDLLNVIGLPVQALLRLVPGLIAG